MPFSPLQTSVSLFPDEALPGMYADLTIGGSSQIESYSAEGNIGFGYGVVGGTTETELSRQCKVPASGAEVTNKFQGFALRATMQEPRIGTDIKAKDSVSVVRKGKLWVPYEGTPVQDGAVYLVNGSGAGTPGKIRHDANGGAATLLPRCVVRKINAALSLAQVEINLP